jgi:hypothetical protein
VGCRMDGPPIASADLTIAGVRGCTGRRPTVGADGLTGGRGEQRGRRRRRRRRRRWGRGLRRAAAGAVYEIHPTKFIQPVLYSTRPLVAYTSHPTPSPPRGPPDGVRTMPPPRMTPGQRSLAPSCWQHRSAASAMGPASAIARHQALSLVIRRHRSSSVAIAHRQSPSLVGSRHHSSSSLEPAWLWLCSSTNCRARATGSHSHPAERWQASVGRRALAAERWQPSVSSRALAGANTDAAHNIATILNGQERPRPAPALSPSCPALSVLSVIPWLLCRCASFAYARHIQQGIAGSTAKAQPAERQEERQQRGRGEGDIREGEERETAERERGGRQQRGRGERNGTWRDELPNFILSRSMSS